MEDYLLYK